MPGLQGSSDPSARGPGGGTSDPKGGHLTLVPEVRGGHLTLVPQVRGTPDPSASSPGGLNLGGTAGTATPV